MMKPFDVLVRLKVDALTETTAMERVEAALHTLGILGAAVVDVRAHEPDEAALILESPPCQAFAPRRPMGDVEALTASPLPAAPDRRAAEPATFSPRADAFLTAQSAPYGVPQAVAAGAGYKVRQDTHDKARWCVEAPDGGIVAVAMRSERDAWDAAFASHSARHAPPGLFSKAVLQGYTVTKHVGPLEEGGPDVEHFEACGPDEAELNEGTCYLTERAAWEACDRHRRGED